MAINQGKLLPITINLDSSPESLRNTEALDIRNYSLEIDSNANLPTGTGNDTGEGQNEFSLKPVKSNKPIDVDMPQGFNLCVGSFESITTQELYYFNFNSNGNHGIYIYDGNTLVWSKVIVDPALNFSDDPKAFIANHRVTLRVTYDNNKQPLEKYLILTDGLNWQKWIGVKAAIETNGFNADQFPYWGLKQPHFDRRELFEYAVRPPMYKPKVKLLDNLAADANTPNRMIDKAFQFSYSFVLTDGRETVLSPWSVPLIVKSEVFLANPQSIPKRGEIEVYGGSALVEKVKIFVRLTKEGLWYLYDTVNRFTDTGVNDPTVIGESYWLRQNPYQEYQYDDVFNTFKYIFSFDRVYQLTDPSTVNIYQNRLPIRSVAQSDIGDAILYSNNEYDYDNFNQRDLDKFKIKVREKKSDACAIPNRKIRLYAMCPSGSQGMTQFGYIKGEGDTQVRFGGIEISGFGNLTVNPEDSEFYGLDFADRQAFRCYLKGTEYFSDGKWFKVLQDFTLEEIPEIYDISSTPIRDSILNDYKSSVMYVCVFDFVVPAGIYVATIGRHNEPSSGNWRGKSTYIAGISNSRSRTLTALSTGGVLSRMPFNRIVNQDKEMEINCLGSDVDVWGNGADVFWIFCPYVSFRSTNPVQRKYKLLEGYLYETPSSKDKPVEYYPYNITEGFPSLVVNGGYTDKNGFFFAYSSDGDAREGDLKIWGRKDCVFRNTNNPFEVINTPNGNLSNNLEGFLDNSTLGACNRILVRGRITNLTGTFGYSNVSVHIFGGAVATTDQDGNFELIVHSGRLQLRNELKDKIYVSASANYTIRLDSCEYIQPYQFNESNPAIICTVCNQRLLEPPELRLNTNIESGSGQRSLKQGGKYPVGLVGFDLAGRSTFVNTISEREVSSFLQRNNLNPTEMFWELSIPLNLRQETKWLGIYVAPNVNFGRYIQWVGDSIEFLDGRFNITNDPSTAEFARIKIDSLLETNIRNNFTLLSNYQFVPGDRLRVFDDGEGTLFDTATFGEPIDAEIYGTNYNDAAVKAGLVRSQSQLVINEDSNSTPDPTTLIVKYDSRLNKLQNKRGFWIEIYQSGLINEELFYGETIIYPVIDGTIARFEGFSGSGEPQYDFLLTDTIPFWDTYYVDRFINIVGASSNYLNHPFESNNITDLWGRDYISSGRVNAENKEAKRRWFRDDTIRSDEFADDGVVNGLGLFREGNRKPFKGYLWGGITATIPQRSVILFLCENDWFTATYNLNYARVDSNGNFVVVNLNQSLGDPTPKIGSNYGCEYDDTRTVVAYDGIVGWHDMKNGGYIICNYQGAVDITEVKEEQRLVGIKSYYRNKCEIASKWNSKNPVNKRIDVHAGIDFFRDDLHITFRPRRENTERIESFVNNRRGYSLEQQETFVFSIPKQRWSRTTSFTPEAYASLRGRGVGVEFISFAKGVPYRHNDNDVRTFNVFYGQETERYVTICVNSQPELNKVLQSLAIDSNRQRMFADLIYGNEPYSLSRISLNRWVLKEELYFAEVLMDESTFPPTSADLQYRTMLFDGKPMYGLFFVVRLVGDPLRKTEYQELNAIYYKYDGREASAQK